MSCNRADINPRSSCGHRHDNRGCTTSSACQRRGAHFGIQRHSDAKTLCLPYEPQCSLEWQNPAPETLQEAVDRLAHYAVLGLSGTGIGHVDGCTGFSQ